MYDISDINIFTCFVNHDFPIYFHEGNEGIYDVIFPIEWCWESKVIFLLNLQIVFQEFQIYNIPLVVSELIGLNEVFLNHMERESI